MPLFLAFKPSLLTVMTAISVEVVEIRPGSHLLCFEQQVWKLREKVRFAPAKTLKPRVRRKNSLSD